MTDHIDRARSICKQIEVNFPSYMRAPACAEAWTTAKLIASLEGRVEALEAAQRPTVKDSLTVPADSLVGRVADAIYSNPTSGVREEARAAILATANWIDQQELHDAATRLRQEVG